jgi:hypothetical protein
MKTKVVIMFAMLISMRAFSQDTLYTKTGGVVNAKVVEINQNEIKYKKASNPDGPVYVMDVSNLVLIHFKNGSKEVFSSGNTGSQTAVDNSNQNNSTSNNPPTVVNNYSSYPGGYGYGYGRPGFNIVVGSPFYRFGPWWGGWGGGYGYYRPYYHNYGWHGGGGHYYGHYGHHGRH